MKPRHIVLAIAAAWATGTVQAEVLSLHAAWQKATDSEPSWRVAQADAQIDKEEAGKARSGLLPRIDLNNTSNINSLNRGGTTSNYDSSSTTLTLRQPLFRLQSFADFQRADTRAEASEFRLSNEAQALAVRVTQAYFDVLQAGDTVRHTGYLERSLTTHLDAARKGFRAGTGTRTDIDDARARLSLSVADRQAAEDALSNARKRLSVIVGAPINEIIPLDEERSRTLRLSPATFDAWLDVARQSSPELAAAKKAVEESSWGMTSARSGYFPTVDLVMSNNQSSSESVATVNSRYTANSVGVQINMPLFSGGHTNADTAQAVARHQRAQALLDNAERQLETRLLLEFNGVQQGEERLASLTVATEASEESLRSTRLGVVAGSRTTLDVLNAERQLYATRLDTARARYNWIMSRIRLHALAGKLDENRIKEVSDLTSLAANNREESASDSITRERTTREASGPASLTPIEPSIPRDTTRTRNLPRSAPVASPSQPPANELRSPSNTNVVAPAPTTVSPEVQGSQAPQETLPNEGALATSPAPLAPAPAQVASPDDNSKPVARPTTMEAAPLMSPRSDGKHVVALGTFGNPDNVARLLAAVEKTGVPVYTEATGNGLTRVRAGPFSSRKAANQAQQALKSAGIAGVLDRR